MLKDHVRLLRFLPLFIGLVSFVPTILASAATMTTFHLPDTDHCNALARGQAPDDLRPFIRRSFPGDNGNGVYQLYVCNIEHHVPDVVKFCTRLWHGAVPSQLLRFVSGDTDDTFQLYSCKVKN